MRKIKLLTILHMLLVLLVMVVPGTLGIVVGLLYGVATGFLVSMVSAGTLLILVETTDAIMNQV